MTAAVWRELKRALRAAWRAVRVWSGDAAYEADLARAREEPRLDRKSFYLQSLERRYRTPSRCC